MRDYQCRIAKLDNLIQSAYEDKVNGKIHENMCVKLLKKYEEEQKNLETEMSALEEKIAARKKQNKMLRSLSKG